MNDLAIAGDIVAATNAQMARPGWRVETFMADGRVDYDAIHRAPLLDVVGVGGMRLSAKYDATTSAIMTRVVR